MRARVQLFAAALILLAGLAVAPASRAATATSACAAEGRVHYLCGVDNVEDMVLAPGTRWIIASGMSGPHDPVGHLYAIDSRAKTFVALTPDVSGPARAPYADCHGPADRSKLAPHGLALAPGGRGRGTLYVVNHGGREAVELFDLDARSGPPRLTWIGCVLMPDHGSGNAVAPLPDGGFVVTKFEDAGDPEAFDKMADMKRTGALYRWTPGAGFAEVPGSVMSGANGVEASADGRWMVANAWPEKRVIRFDLKGVSKPVPIRVPFLPDNVRAAPGGSMLVAGQDSDMRTLLACKVERCPHAWTVSRLDPATMAPRTVLHIDGTQAFSDATVGLQVGRTIWVGTYRGDRVAWVELP